MKEYPTIKDLYFKQGGILGLIFGSTAISFLVGIETVIGIFIMNTIIYLGWFFSNERKKLQIIEKKYKI